MGVLVACSDAPHGSFDAIIRSLDVLEEARSIEQHRACHAGYPIETPGPGDDAIKLATAEIGVEKLRYAIDLNVPPLQIYVTGYTVSPFEPRWRYRRVHTKAARLHASVRAETPGVTLVAEKICALWRLVATSMSTKGTGARKGGVGDTGRFTLIDVDCESDDRRKLARVTEVKASCHACGTVFVGNHAQGLTSIFGGAVLCCPSCPNRQAIGQGVFETFPGTKCLG